MQTRVHAQVYLCNLAHTRMPQVLLEKTTMFWAARRSGAWAGRWASGRSGDASRSRSGPERFKFEKWGRYL